MSLRESFGSLKVRTERLYVPDIDQEVLVKGLTGEQLDTFQSAFIGRNGRVDRKPLSEVKARLIVLAVCDPQSGERIWSDADADIAQVRALPARVTHLLFSKASSLSGLGEEDAAEMGKPIESPTPGAPLSSALPVN